MTAPLAMRRALEAAGLPVVRPLPSVAFPNALRVRPAIEVLDRKRCSRCGEIKPLDAFHQALGNQCYLGRLPNCKACRALTTREWREAVRHAS